MLLRTGNLDLSIRVLKLEAQGNEEENPHVFHKTLFYFLLVGLKRTPVKSATTLQEDCTVSFEP